MFVEIKKIDQCPYSEKKKERKGNGQENPRKDNHLKDEKKKKNQCFTFYKSYLLKPVFFVRSCDPEGQKYHPLHLWIFLICVKNVCHLVVYIHTQNVG